MLFTARGSNASDAKYTVNGIVAALFTLAGVAAFLWMTFTLAPSAFAASPILVYVADILAVLGVILFLYPMRQHLMGWVRGEKAPWLSALGMIGGGVGAAMVVAFLLSPELGVLGIWDFSALPRSLWAQIIAFALIVISGVWYILAKNARAARGINVEFAFKEIPPE